MSTPTATARPFIEASDCRLDDFVAQVSRDTELADFPHAADVRANVLVYRADSVVDGDSPDIKAELIRALTEGPGVLVVEGAFGHGVVDAASEAFWTLIAEQRAGGNAAGDHFGRPGTNDRVWNAAQKLALHDPRLFAEYYANRALATVSQAWLGPRYEMTSQINVVNPGGAAQVPHRDYHLAMIPGDQLAAYPAHLHRMSSVLTLQGAVAHCDMPLESGPTMFLPYSQTFAAGYVAFRRPEFIDFFGRNYVQVPLRKGDAVFFNPALFHGAGANASTGIRRIANLLQISSPLGRAMEAIDHSAMVRAVYPALRAMKAEGRDSQDLLNAVVAAADPYPFPTNLDRDPPIDSLCPQGQVELVLAALADGLTDNQLDVALRDRDERRNP